MWSRHLPIPQNNTQKQTQLFSCRKKERVVVSGKLLGKSFPCCEYSIHSLRMKQTPIHSIPKGPRKPVYCIWGHQALQGASQPTIYLCGTVPPSPLSWIQGSESQMPAGTRQRQWMNRSSQCTRLHIKYVGMIFTSTKMSSPVVLKTHSSLELPLVSDRVWETEMIFKKDPLRKSMVQGGLWMVTDNLSARDKRGWWWLRQSSESSLVPRGTAGPSVSRQTKASDIYEQ